MDIVGVVLSTLTACITCFVTALRCIPYAKKVLAEKEKEPKQTPCKVYKKPTMPIWKGKAHAVVTKDLEKKIREHELLDAIIHLRRRLLHPSPHQSIISRLEHEERLEELLTELRNHYELVRK